MEPEDPVNPNFEALGFESIYFVHNIGTLFLTLLMIPVLLLFVGLMNLPCCKKCCLCKRVGDYFYRTWIWSGTYKVLHTNYGIVAICALINFKNLRWANIGETICAALTILGII